MPEPISSIKTTAEIVKTATEVVKPDTVAEIHALQHSDDPRLQNAGNYEADTKQKIAEAKNLLVTLVHAGLVLPIKMTKGAMVKIVESFSLHSESTKQAINQKIESLKNQGFLSGEISSIPAFADMAERLVYLDEEPDLKQMFEDLLISTVDSTKTNINHPAYVEILKQINNQEAKKLKVLFEKSEEGIPICNINLITNDQGHYQIIQKYIIPNPYSDISQKELENWERLKLIIINMEIYWTNDQLYSYAQNIIDEANKTAVSPLKLELTKGQLTFTEFGKNFAKAVGIIK
ncbi:DUF4393 domain-containing protein [Aggregatibacter kilianii]|uniref:DUF4393 domain-containing protein n=1 Tax=Aggregatibacter kilianii TaxID=2025884 RepID=UPI000D654B2E|nr:DUF4393 domain-containing protein [Aggregatibacter kilianii]